MTSVPRSIYFVSLGCPKNRVDSEVMLGSLAEAGHVLVQQPDEAEVIVVNTCGFIDAAKEESIDTILEMAQYKESGSCRKLVVTGCLTQRYPDEVAARDSGNRPHPGLGRLRRHRRGGGGEAARPPRGAQPAGHAGVRDARVPLRPHAPRIISGPRFSVYVKIAEGCDRPCSFCIIPKLRGPQRSRSIDSVAAEVEHLVAEGAREINLVAQDLTRYGADLDDKPTLAQLLARLGRIDDLRWIRMHYTYPSAWSDELIEVVAGEPKVVKYVDVPLQHIDDQMLKMMRRGHSSRVTGALLERLRKRIPDLVLRSTFIVGHPGETDEMFESLCRFVETEELDRVGVFTYSREAGTTSALLPHRVPADVAVERRDRLMEIQRGISRRKNQALVGRDLEVLVEGVSDESELLLQGRWYGQAPEIDGSVYLADGSAQPGDLVRARVTDGSDYDLAASLAPSAAEPA